MSYNCNNSPVAAGRGYFCLWNIPNTLLHRNAYVVHAEPLFISKQLPLMQWYIIFWESLNGKLSIRDWFTYVCGHSACILSWFCTLENTDFLMHEIFSIGWSPFGILLNNSKWLQLTPSWNIQTMDVEIEYKAPKRETFRPVNALNICVILVRYFNFSTF